MKSFYVDLVRGSRFALLAGPFPDEATARKYEKPAVALAQELDLWAAFDPYGVISIDNHFKPGVLNDRLNIDPADLLEVGKEAA